MNEQVIITVYVVIDDTLKAMGHSTDKRAVRSDAEVLTVAVLAAKYFHNHHERALWMLKMGGYVGQGLSLSRFNRRLHALSDWLLLSLESVCALANQREPLSSIVCRCRCAVAVGLDAVEKCRAGVLRLLCG